LISGWLRSSHNPYRSLEEIIKELRGIGGSTSSGFGENKVRSLPDAISKVLYKELKINNVDKLEEVEDKHTTLLKSIDLENIEQKVRVPVILNAAVCPDCGNMSLIYAEGCEKCTGCGYSRC